MSSYGVHDMKHTRKGSLTAEAALVMPVILFVLMLLIRMCIVHYQNAVTSAEAMRVAARMGIHWQELSGDHPLILQDADTAENWITDSNFLEHNPYQGLVELLNGSSVVRKKLQHIKTYAARVMQKTPNLLGEDTEVAGVEVKRQQGILQNYIVVTVTRQNENPLGFLYDKLGITSPDKYRISAKGVQQEPTEFMRNISLLYDFLKGEFKR